MYTTLVDNSKQQFLRKEYFIYKPGESRNAENIMEIVCVRIEKRRSNQKARKVL